MDLKRALISADDHVLEPPDLWTSRVSARWINRVPHVESQSDGTDCWVIEGRRFPLTGTATAGAGLEDRSQAPRRGAEVPRSYCEAKARLEAMNQDGVEYSVLYPTVTGVTGEALAGIEDLDLRIACVRAYNDWLIDDWGSVDARLIPQCLVPLTSVEAATEEVQRAVARGHRGVIFPSIPTEVGLVPHINDAAWDPFWSLIEELEVPLCFHAGGPGPIQIAPDERLSPRLGDAFRAITRPASHIPVMVNFLLSKILLRHPKLRVVFAESALGWVAYLLEFTDHQFREDRVDREGYELNPSAMFRRQCYVTSWYDQTGIRTRHHIGVDNIMWSTNFPLTTSTWPDTKKFVDRGLKGVPDDERARMLWANAAELYKLR